MEEIKFKIKYNICPSCGCKMMLKAKPGIFPQYFKEDQHSQCRKHGIEFTSKSKIDDDYICETCEKAGKAKFRCSLCGEIRESDKIQITIGDPAEYLCKKCYETVSAKNWEEKNDELEKKHRYDYL